MTTTIDVRVAVRDRSDPPQLQPLADLDEAVTWAMVESSPDGMLLANEHGVLMLVNEQIETLFGYDRGELLGLAVETLLPERHRNVHTAHRTRYRAAAISRAMGGDLALIGRRQDGTEFPVEVLLSPITTTQGLRVVATVRDITERLATEAGLRRNESRLRVLQDRERLARDVHDIVIQRLFAAGMGLQAVVGSITDAHVEQRVSDTVDELDRTIADLRVAVFELTNASASTVAEQIDEVIEHAAVHLTFAPRIVIDGDVDSIPAELCEHLVPVLTEALSNVARHACAATVTIALRIDSENISLTVTDDGVGIRSTGARGNGLDNLAARAHQVGGTICIDSHPDTGTTLTWTTPRRTTPHRTTPRRTTRSRRIRDEISEAAGDRGDNHSQHRDHRDREPRQAIG